MLNLPNPPPAPPKGSSEYEEQAEGIADLFQLLAPTTREEEDDAIARMALEGNYAANLIMAGFGRFKVRQRDEFDD